MKTTFIMSLLFIVLVSSACAPRTVQLENGYLVEEDRPFFVVIGASESINDWQPHEVCEPVENITGDKGRALKCKTPVSVTVYTYGQISVTLTNAQGIPISLPR